MPSAVAIGDTVSAADLSPFRAFLILAFDDDDILQLNWDGKSVTSLQGGEVKCPLTTSGFLPDEVADYRRTQFASKFGAQPERSYETLVAFQSEHNPQMPAHSVLMSRKDARTVSQTRVRVSNENVRLAYFTVSEANVLEPAGEEGLSRV
jgi:hypothetical protein